MAEGGVNDAGRRQRELEWTVVHDHSEDIRRGLGKLSPSQLQTALEVLGARDLCDSDEQAATTVFLSVVEDGLKRNEDPSMFEKLTNALQTARALDDLVKRLKHQLSELLRQPPPSTAHRSSERLKADSGLLSVESAVPVLSVPAQSSTPVTTSGDRDKRAPGEPSQQSKSEPSSSETQDFVSSASTIAPIIPTFTQCPTSSAYGLTLETSSLTLSSRSDPDNSHRDPTRVHPTPESQQPDPSGAFFGRQ